MKNQFLTLVALAFTAAAATAQTGNYGIGNSSPASKLTVNGSMAASYNNVTAATYTLNANDYYVAFNGTAAGTFTLPAAVAGSTTAAAGSPSTGTGGNLQGRVYNIKNTSSVSLTVQAAGSELLDNQSGAGVANITIPAGYYAIIISKGTTSSTTWEVASIANAAGVGGADNGLTVGYNSPGKIGLGGTLAKNTTIANAGFSLADTGTGNFSVGRSHLLDAASTGAAAFGITDSLNNAPGALVAGTSNKDSSKNSLVFGNNNVLAAGGAQTNRGVLLGGGQNVVSGTSYNSIINGSQNTVSGSSFESIITGYLNNVSNAQKSLVGGQGNTVAGAIFSQVSGLNNSDSSSFTTLSGYVNKIGSSADYTKVSGSNNTVGTNAGFNTVTGKYNTVLSPLNTVGGDSNYVNATGQGLNAVFGLRDSVQAGGAGGSIISGHDNLDSSSSYSLVVGHNNRTFGSGNALVYGATNTITGNAFSTLVGGGSNVVNGSFLSMIGGSANTLNGGEQSLVAGGSNTLSAGFSAVLGGNNTDSAYYSMVAGQNNKIYNGATYGTAFGSGNSVKNTNSMAIGTSVSTTANNQFVSGFSGGHNFYTNSNTAPSVTIASTGNVGIGTTTPGSTLDVKGSVAANYNQVTATTYALTNTDFYTVYNGTAASTFTLPAALAAGSGNFKGRLYNIKNTTAGQTLTITPNGAETIDGNSSLTINPGQSVQLVSTGLTSGATWEVVSFTNTQSSSQAVFVISSAAAGPGFTPGSTGSARVPLTTSPTVSINTLNTTYGQDNGLTLSDGTTTATMDYFVIPTSGVYRLEISGTYGAVSGTPAAAAVGNYLQAEVNLWRATAAAPTSYSILDSYRALSIRVDLSGFYPVTPAVFIRSFNAGDKVAFRQYVSNSTGSGTAGFNFGVPAAGNQSFSARAVITKF